MSAPWVLDHVPYAPFVTRRTARPPGLSPLAELALVTRDADFEAQMAERHRLLGDVPAEVLACLPEGREPSAELLRHVAAEVGRAAPDAACPLEGLGRIGAEDWCLLLPDAATGEYRLVGAVLCFPSRWRLTEKLGRPMSAIHAPVPDYDDALARRVNRVFAALAVARPLWRANWLIHVTPQLFLPMSPDEKASPETPPGPGTPLYLRTERQTLSRLPETGAIAFGIKTSVSRIEALSEAQRCGLRDATAALTADEVAYRMGAELHAALLKRLDRLCA